ncbi:DUF6712 family protein [Flavobacterium beibuense]|uniref:DUF6712 family protein n=1 Tax=Flavobacterium beibuense TaxID=657326 RepID=UPI003A901940
MILASTDDLRKHVAIAKSLHFPDVEPYIDQAVYQFTERYVGDLHLTLAEPATGENADILNKARNILQNALSNFVLYLYTPIGSVIFDSSGFGNAESDTRSKLEWTQIRDLQRGFLMAGHTAMDRLLSVLEKNKTIFPTWAESEQYTESKELLVSNTKTFNDCYTIYDSRQTYLALKPAMRQIEDQFLYTFLCPELITFLKEGEPSGVQLQVKKYLQKAIVAFTIAKVVNEGVFIIDGSSIKIKFDTLPSDKVYNPDYGKPADFLTQTSLRQKEYGQNYLSMAENLIKANPEEFTQCESPIIVKEEEGGFMPYNTKGVLGL